MILKRSRQMGKSHLMTHIIAKENGIKFDCPICEALNET